MTGSIGVFEAEFLSHRSNLQQKQIRVTDTDESRLVGEALTAYESYLKAVDWNAVALGDCEVAVGALGEYLRIAKDLEHADRLFNWRSDYAGSIVPEFLYMALHSVATLRGLEVVFSTRNSVVELTMSNEVEPGFNVRRKNQDLSVGFVMQEIVSEGNQVRFLVPVVVSEIKTNTDINKLSGLSFSAERLKRTFPGSSYFLVTETIDFSLDDNYAAGAVDQVYVLRKQLRSAARRNRDPLCPDVCQEYINDVLAKLERASSSRGHVYDRLESGKLIYG
jgi:hypothetical protein